MLLAGGMVLGDAMSDQPDPSKPGHGILVLIADGLGGILKSANASTWVVAIVFCGLMWLIGNFVSHTVSAIMLIPVVAEVGCLLANGDCAAGHTKLLVMLTTMIDSGAMALPVSSFPNAQMYSETDKHGRQILAGSDFIKTGFLVGLLEVGVVISGGYFLMLAVGL
jgi:di/tricarboxylate transporter